MRDWLFSTVMPTMQRSSDILRQAVARFDMRPLAYCLMPNHFHLLLWPRENGDLTAFMRWLTMTHTQRWHAHHRTAGTGLLYLGRYKSFSVQSGEHLLTVCRYVERNALRQNFVLRRNGSWGASTRSSGQRQGGATDVDALADRTSARLDRAVQPAVRPERQGGDAWQHAATSTVPFGVPAGRGSGEARSGVVAPDQR